MLIFFPSMKFELLVSLIIIICVDATFDPSKIDYCDLKCLGKNPSSACSELCKWDKDREEMMEDPEKFRQTILDQHNLYRNQIARGDEKGKGYPPAADMQILNYDLELEHSIRCYIMSDRFGGGHDSCRQVSYCNGTSGPGQNLAGLGVKGDMVKQAKEAVDLWYGSEIELIPSEKREKIVDKFEFGHDWGHFSEVVWAKVNLLGCVRVWIPKLNPKQEHLKPYILTIACNYAMDKWDWDYPLCAGNMPNKAMYKKGDPCSMCPKGKKCNKDTSGGKYDALCGELKPVPKDKPEDIEKNAMPDKKGDAARIVHNKLGLALPVLALVINKALM